MNGMRWHVAHYRKTYRTAWRKQKLTMNVDNVRKLDENLTTHYVAVRRLEYITIMLYRNKGSAKGVSFPLPTLKTLG